MAIGTFGGTLTLVSVADGESGDSYSIETNYEKIYKFYSQNSDDPVYSPDSLIFKVHGADGTSVLPISDYTSEISLIGQTSQISNIWALLDRLQGYPLVETDTPEAVNLLTVGRVIDSQAKTTEFQFVELFGYDITKSELGNAPADISAFNNLLKTIREENCYFIIEIFKSNSLLANRAVLFEFGTSEDMAKFAVTANAIEAAVSNTKLEFNANGLSIKNGGLTIYNENSEKIFYYDENAQILHVEGTGTFTGTINASGGSFTGDVSADTLIARAGTIGGFTIENDGLYSQDGSIKLLGTEGRIEADNINLGTGVHVNRYIQFGNNALIWNPDENDTGIFIEVKHNNVDAVTLSEDGILNIGQITLNGQNSEISGKSFVIAPGLASFTNISASGKISTAIFEQGHTQSVGGSMMFKPSYKIKEYNGNTLTLDQNYQGSVGNYVYIVGDDGAVIPGLNYVTEIDDDTITLVNNIAYEGELVSLIDIGVENDLIIGVNSSNTSNSFLKPRGITISEFNLGQEQGSSIKYIDENINPKVFLGDLDTANIDFSDTGSSLKTRGFGLYSENVYLTGSLTTKVNNNNDNPTFAGVNTLDGVPASVFADELGDESAIVFWAGSRGVSSEEIQKAPFQVTEKGSIYASQGKFTGAIITDSFIRGVDLYTARIHGTGLENEQDYGLAFYDTSEGIVFFEGTPDNASEVFSIGNSGFKKENSYFIEISDSGIVFNGESFKGINYYTDMTQNSYIHLFQNSIIGAHTVNENQESLDTKITFNQQEINFGVKSNTQNLSVKQNLIKMSTDSVQMDNTVLFGERLKYEKVTNGYNLFVLGEQEE